jgi:hypothetical protein
MVGGAALAAIGERGSPKHVHIAGRRLYDCAFASTVEAGTKCPSDLRLLSSRQIARQLVKSTRTLQHVLTELRGRHHFLPQMVPCFIAIRVPFQTLSGCATTPNRTSGPIFVYTNALRAP